MSRGKFGVGFGLTKKGMKETYGFGLLFTTKSDFERKGFMKASKILEVLLRWDKVFFDVAPGAVPASYWAALEQSRVQSLGVCELRRRSG